MKRVQKARSLLSGYLSDPVKKSIILHFFVLFAVFAVVCLINFPYGKWYTGWDNLHPEFNFWLNIKRAFQSVWQTNQGLGTYGGHGYAATLPHSLVLGILSLIIPKMYLRVVFTLLMLFLGSAGVFFMTRKLIKKDNEGLKNKAALMAGLFYMLNFGTVQNFYIQLEAFIVHFAALPWLFLSLINVFDKYSKKNLLIFALVTFLSSSQGFIPPLFIAYVLFLGIFLFFYVFLSKEKILRLKRALGIFILTLFINSYWLLPVVYYSFNQSQVYLNSNNNILSTEDFILKNQKYGTWQHVPLIRGFYVEALDAVGNGVIFTIFDKWSQHLAGPLVSFLGYGFFILAALGALLLFRKRVRSAYLIASSVSFFLAFSLLSTNIYPFSQLSRLIENVPVLRQAFRVVFTKFSISFSFFFAICFGLGTYILLSWIKKNSLRIGLSVAFFVSLVYFSWPTFRGNFFYQRTKVEIPKIYFELFDFFKKQPKTERIANFPQGWNWGWSVYRWGYSGSGFLWYGIEQPILDRAFDAWGNYNENYYWEVSYAIYSEKFQLLDNLFEKYQIRWIVLDQNIIPYPNVKGFLYSDKLEEYLDGTKKYQLVKVLSAGKIPPRPIKIYGVNLNSPANNFKSTLAINDVLNIGPTYDWTNYDKAFEEFGTYYTEPNQKFDVFYPSRSLFTGRTSDFPLDSQLSKAKKELVYSSQTDPYFLNHQAKNCGLSNEGSFSQKNIGNKLLFSSTNSENCYDIIFSSIEQRNAYLVEIESKHVKGKSLKFALINHDSKRPDLEIYLGNNLAYSKKYIIIPPMKYYGLGYNLHFNNISIGKDDTVNELKSISVWKIPFDLLKEIKQIEQIPKDSNDNKNLLIYYQSFHPGWKAYANGQELQEHVLINNWANGWVLDQNQSAKISIVFWPQYLEYLGFALLVITFIIIIIVI